MNCAAYTFKVRFFGLHPQNIGKLGDAGSVAHNADELQEASSELRAEEAGAVKPHIPTFEITEIEFITQTHNTTFSYFELLSRFVAFLAAFGLLAGFCLSMRSFEWKYWTAEQKWTVVLLVLLLFFYSEFDLNGFACTASSLLVIKIPSTPLSEVIACCRSAPPTGISSARLDSTGSGRLFSSLLLRLSTPLLAVYL
ncbi:unnamed protein product [Hydatigera taeniaeformis]|uniref:Wntless-like transmembrane domain-containing protein n=1 Tax=Hydatigena taeniaeformis TaxID=6205 RepID=A0A3P7EHL6_HYDTA|nr:unnamed protein product [Hydatigera taeniaeformis]